MTDDELFEKYFKESLSPEEGDELKGRLRDNEATRKAFARYAEERSILVRLTGRLAGMESRELPPLPSGAPRRFVMPSPPRRSVHPFFIVAGIAAAAVLLLSILWNAPSPEPAAHPRPETSRKTPTPEPRAPEPPRPAPTPEPPKPEVRKPDVPAVPKPEEPKKTVEPEPQPAPKPEEAPKPEPKRETVPERAIATLDRIEGNVLKVAGGAKSPARAGDGLFPGQGLETAGAKSAAVVAYPDGTRLRLEGDAVARDLRTDNGKRLTLDQGTLGAEVARQPEGQPLTIVTPHGRADVLGTTFKMIVLASSGTRVEVKEGRVRLTRKSDEKTVTLLADQAAELTDPPNGNRDTWVKYSRKIETGSFTHVTVGFKTGTRSASGPTVGIDSLRVTPGGSEDFDSMPRWDSAFDGAWGGPAAWTLEPGGASGKFLQAARPGPGSSVKTRVFAVPARSTIDVSASLKCPSDSKADFWVEFGVRPGVHSAQDFDANAAQWTIVKKFDSSPPGEIDVRPLQKK